MTRMLRQGEDEIAQHYAVKTIENIASHGADWAHKFSSQETVGSLVAIMSGAKSEQLRGTAASTLSSRQALPAVLNLVLDKYGIKILVNGLRDTSPKVQQASLNLLNRGLADLGARARAALAAEDNRGLLPTLVALLERGSAVLRGKAPHPRVPVPPAQPMAPRRVRNPAPAVGGPPPEGQEQYLQRCLEALVATVVAACPSFTTPSFETTGLAGGRPGSRNGRGAGNRERERRGRARGAPRTRARGRARREPTDPRGRSFRRSSTCSGPSRFARGCATTRRGVRRVRGRGGREPRGFGVGSRAAEFSIERLRAPRDVAARAPTLVQTVPGAVTTRQFPALADVLARGGSGATGGVSSADGRFLALKLTR